MGFASGASFLGAGIQVDRFGLGAALEWYVRLRDLICVWSLGRELADLPERLA